MKPISVGIGYILVVLALLFMVHYCSPEHRQARAQEEMARQMQMQNEMQQREFKEFRRQQKSDSLRESKKTVTPAENWLYNPYQ